MKANLKNIVSRCGLGLVAVMLAGVAVAGQTTYRSELSAWRKQQEAELKASDGWLTVAGLFWLKEGPNRFGTDPDNEIVLPAGSAPGKTGTFELRHGVTTLTVAEGASVTSQGQPVQVIEMQPDTTETPTVVRVRDLSLTVIKRGERYGIRLRDKNSRLRREFTGLHWFSAQESYRVTARFVPHAQPTEIAITNVLGDTLKMTSTLR